MYVEDHILHISGEEKEENKEKDKENKKYIVKERKVASFERSFSLPEDADEEKLEARYAKGILSIEAGSPLCERNPEHRDSQEGEGRT